MSGETAWRRRWKHTLHTVTWQPLLKTNEKYFIKCLFTQNHYEILISDLRQSFYEKLNEESFQKRSKKLNPSVEAPISRLLDHIRAHLTAERTEKDTSITTKVSEEDKLILTMETKLAGLPFLWKFQALACSHEMVADHLTTPLMGMVGELLRRQGELVKIIQSKDKEIDDYRNQGAKVTRKHLQTSVFDDTAFINNMETSQGFEQQVRKNGKNAFDADGQNLYQCIMMKNAYLERDADSESDDVLEEEENVKNSTTSFSPKKPGGQQTTTQSHSWANRVPGSLVSPGSSSASPSKSPAKSPIKMAVSPVKDAEMLRRQALEKRLLEEEEKQGEKQKKKKKKLKL